MELHPTYSIKLLDLWRGWKICQKNKENKHIIEADPQMIQMLELVEKNFKITMIDI